jgi:hypothetical protein
LNKLLLFEIILQYQYKVEKEKLVFLKSKNIFIDLINPVKKGEINAMKIIVKKY